MVGELTIRALEGLEQFVAHCADRNFLHLGYGGIWPGIIASLEAGRNQPISPIDQPGEGFEIETGVVSMASATALNGDVSLNP